jgi:hypothetical protein
MERSGQRRRLDYAAAPFRIRKQQLVVIPDFAGNADPSVKVFEIRAAAKSDVLAVVDIFA